MITFNSNCDFVQQATEQGHCETFLPVAEDVLVDAMFTLINGILLVSSFVSLVVVEEELDRVVGEQCTFCLYLPWRGCLPCLRIDTFHQRQTDYCFVVYYLF